MPPLLLVRHASAGARGHGPSDLERPLDARGRTQADALARLLAPELAVGPDVPCAILTSPARRCVETVTPLAAALGAPIVIDDALVEGSDVGPLLARLPELAVPTVWASHGDVIPELLAALARRGVDLGDDPRCRKGSTWVLAVEAGAVTAARALAPPA